MILSSKYQPHHLLLVTPTNSSQSDIIHSNICKEQGKDSFYSEFVLQSIIKMFEPFGVWQGGGVAYLNEVDKTLFLYVR